MKTDNDICELHKLGWRNEEISKQLKVPESYVVAIIDIFNNFFKKSVKAEWDKNKSIEEIAKRHGLSILLVFSIVAEDKTDLERMEMMGCELKVYDVWNFKKPLDFNYNGMIRKNRYGWW